MEDLCHTMELANGSAIAAGSTRKPAVLAVPIFSGLHAAAEFGFMTHMIIIEKRTALFSEELESFSPSSRLP